ncbi:glycoside hydrolase superfamily [Irpex rosettiformis]|uniref:Glycoside hydrolase superfamily n=1 Tax=Irpex rosettiformis TaxID=378272 RepID=A0ACB8TZG9_9APHY|nr:glycoside hydrolase superfamily [Irpex rosettiformis]
MNSTNLNVPFLNLLATLQERSGQVNVRVGGNTQENATLVDSLPDGKALLKTEASVDGPNESPTLTLSNDFLYALSNISSLVSTKWYLGVPFNDTNALRLQIVEVGESILGDNLLGFQVGNEPDFYASHSHRPSTYSPADYNTEFGTVVQAIAQNPEIKTRNNLIGPSVASGPWSPEDVWNTGFIEDHASALSALAVEHYPDNNCAKVFPNGGFGDPKDPQAVFANYLNHTSGIAMVQSYLNSASLAKQAGKPLLMFETNTASCGGFPGVSDSFGAALWATDYGLQMAYSGFSGALLHVGGQSAFYNPFTPPPGNESSIHQWTIGSTFYAAVAVAETFGKSGKAQIVDLQANGDNMYTPGYAIYENGSLSRVALFNYITDPSGTSDYTVSLSIADGTGPSQVYVKYLVASSVSEKYNITWAGQTMGGEFASDGRFQGDESIQTVTCDHSTGTTCSIKVPAPGFALVFLSSEALSESEPSSTMTFATTVTTKTATTATIDSSVLATAQGQSGRDRQHNHATSKGSSGATMTATTLSSTIVTISSLFGVLSVVWLC